MPKSLSKVTKQISKKRGSKSSALHEFSRDSRRLQAAGLRDEKILRSATQRSKQNQPTLQRVHHFQLLAQSPEAPETFDASSLQSAILAYLARADDELAALKAARRPGRPPAPREQLLEQRVAAERKEFDGGFYCPDLRDAATVERLRAWDGEWVGCNALKFARVTKAGEVRESVWPPNGLS
ncbi:translation machinery-associated protein [Diplodia corticola]|uniref:Translation machinery-associated protein n=1 Tax=Diplodia corticola TaxID=236234 RepID=A0A1J9S2B9_9PEZI|nr:translation machinery-associated protein [Diplodia corticola]OJD34719.1 translation machinery-associated protein [Diplodia corticola]